MTTVLINNDRKYLNVSNDYFDRKHIWFLSNSSLPNAFVSSPFTHIFNKLQFHSTNVLDKSVNNSLHSTLLL